MRVVITRAGEDAGEFADLLTAEGFEPVSIPAIRVVPTPDTEAFSRAFEKLNRFDWLIFTSCSGVDIFFKRLAATSHMLSDRTRIAAVGEKTAACIRAFGHSVDFIPSAYLGNNIPAGLGDIAGKTILLPTADIADPALPDSLSARGASVHVLTAYCTLPAVPDPEALATLEKGVDVITFTSGSTARNFHDMVEHTGMDPLSLPNNPRIACIGPKTAEAAARLGYVDPIIADPYTLAGLVSAIANFRKEASS